MKTMLTLIILGLTSFSGLNINAQDFRFGLLAGLDIANSHWINIPDMYGGSKKLYPMISFNLNAYAGYKSVGLWGMSVEPGFIQKGGVQKFFGDVVRLQLNYIQLPVLADFYLSDRFFISAGPELAYAIDMKAKSITRNYVTDISDFYDNRFELSGMIGLNYKIIEKLDIGLRYNHGITNTSSFEYTDSNGNPLGEMKEYNQYIQLILRFII